MRAGVDAVHPHDDSGHAGDSGTVIVDLHRDVGVLSDNGEARGAENRQLAIAFVMPDTGAGVTLFAVVDPDQTVADVSRLNNVARVDIGKPAVAVDSMSWSAVGPDLVVVTVHVSNDGASSNAPVTLTLNRDSALGAVLFSQVIPGLA